MILIDAIYINNSGGKVLLDYLIAELEKTDKQVFYLLDFRIQDESIKIKSTNKVIYSQASLMKRRSFYKENKNKFSTILCFGNLPPNIKTSAKVYTYFHQLLFLDLPKEMPFVQKKIYYIKTQILNNFKKNTDYWVVQTDLVKERLSQKYKISENTILTLPFYPPFDSQAILPKKEHQYIYISNVSQHKNHGRLMEAFSRFYDLHKKGKLILTIPDEAEGMLNIINTKRNQGYPIENIGFVERESLQKLYAESEYLIFPSLTESFGLGLVEAIENRCKIISSDLPYTYAVCKPSLVFDPLDVNSITEALSLSLQKNTINSESKVTNEINNLISCLF
ncbi:glycosyltransferase involved in cell wall biosynthesis [Chryseobacterium ginsenosidimutans]|uniref:glycosyltransferase n=1 Tax=Chryseobacterium ginsenosidimutans TaxID=687846 RepID=UPI002166DAB6|nr:glycosyltransferase [Chryseobacterium ginsenosidimutans]MCS3871087.1 glycosyltransferase involved in cell wall biosynthesis [Chryseobacterium ginsenosidimutans]